MAKKIRTMQELRQQFPALAEIAEDNGQKKPKIPMPLQRDILRHAAQHGLTINPFGLDYYAISYIKTGHCACDPGRKICPCPESVEECQVKGYCKCRLYWRDLKTFIETMGWREINESDV